MDSKPVTGNSSQRSQWWEHNLRYIFVLPTVLMILGLSLFPLLYSLWVSFLQWDLQRPQTRFIWFKNYADVLRDVRMWEALGHTLFIIVVAVLVELLLGLILAQTLSGNLPAFWGEASALSLIATLPVVILTLLVQKHLAAGLTLGAVK